MKISRLFLAALLAAAPASVALAADDMDSMEGMHHGMSMPEANDARVSLNFPPAMRRQQMAVMRAHVAAIRDIVDLIAQGDFDEASAVAHAKLGLTSEMKKMCLVSGNEAFAGLGLAFHQSGDDLGDVLKSRNLEKSLQALHKTMGYCVDCHAKFRQ